MGLGQAAAAAPGSACAARSPGATACSWRSRSARPAPSASSRVVLAAAAGGGRPRPARPGSRDDSRHGADATGGSRKRQRSVAIHAAAVHAGAHGDSRTYDVAIIGGGAAGLSAALVLGRARRRVVVIDAGTPRNAPAAHMQGFLSRDGTPPAELLRAARAEVRRYGVEIVEDRVVDATAGFALRLAERPDRRGPTGAARDRRRRRAARCRGRPRALGPRLPALPVLPRLGGARPADRRARHGPGPSSTRTCSANGPTT